MRALLGLFALAIFLVPATAFAADPIALTLKDHKFSPSEIKVPAGKSFTMKLTNQDPTPEEFESKTMDFEKVVAGGSSIIVHVLPLKAGKYLFYGEYHEDSAKGHVVAE
jgi:plastocyanin